MQRALCAKYKISFINETLYIPSLDNSLIDCWECCNDMVVSWLKNSIGIPLRSSVAFVDHASEIWIELRERFS